MFTPNITFKELEDVHTPKPPWSGLWWKPVHHHELATILLQWLECKGWKFTEPVFCVSKDKMEMAMSLEVEIEDIPCPVGCKSLCLGVTNANNGHKKIRLWCGAVTNSGTSIVTGQVPFTRRHVRKLDLDEAVEDGLLTWEQDAKEANGIIRGLKYKKLSQTQAKILLVEAGRIIIMPWSRVGRIDKIFYFEDCWTSLNLLQSFAKIVRMNPPIKHIEQVNAFREMLPTNYTPRFDKE
jgi:hypothetical protein